MKPTKTSMGLTIAASCLLVAACSLPVRSYRGSPVKTTALGQQPYKIQQITPAFLAAQAQEQAGKRHKVGTKNPVLQQALASYVYRVEPSDVLRITVWGDPAQTTVFSASSSDSGGSGYGFKVNADGGLYFPYVGDIHVAGDTVKEIRDRLSKLMTPYLKNPQVTVKVVDFNSQKYEIAGTVDKPGLYPITDVPLTVSQAIAAAGGVQHQTGIISAGNSIPRPIGDLSRVLYIHDDKTSVLNLRALNQFGDQSQNRLVRPGDVIQVPDNAFEQVHLIGEVQNPANYPLDDGRGNLAQILGYAGGLNLNTADPARIFIFRGAYRKPQVFWLDARSPDAMLLATDFELEPQDVIYVATSGLSAWNRVITQILPTVQTLQQTKTLLDIR